MNKKILLLLVLSLVNSCLLYGEGQTEKLIRKSGAIYRLVNDKLIKLDNKAITVKLKEGKVLSKNVKAIRSNVLGYIDVVKTMIKVDNHEKSIFCYKCTAIAQHVLRVQQ